MSPDHMTLVQQLFTATCDLDPAARALLLGDSDVDTDLRYEVASLLRYHDLGEAEGFLTVNATTAATDALLGQRIGPYAITALLGSGGMGSVYRAVRVADYHQEVAVKVTAHLSPDALARFEAERQVLADLVHPRIARLLDGGVLADGRPYLVMEYIPGQRLDQYVEAKQLPLVERAKLLVDICGAMTYAHERGVIHRDLKPGNLLVNDDGTAHVVDFGLARRLDTAVDQTRSTALLGTPDYMAPEQAAGHAKAATPATDVYALGAVLYALLTGRPPFRSEAPLLTLQRIREEEPLPPSRLNPAVPRDLETICLKCLEKEPARRYPTAQALAEDLQRFLQGEPVLARRLNRLARVWRWARRHPLPATLTALLVFITVGGLVVVTILWQLAVAHSQQAERDRDLTRQAADQMLEQVQTFSDFPGVQRHQVEATEKILALYEKLVRESTDYEARWRLARTRRILASWYEILGEQTRKQQLLLQIVAELEALVKEQPDRKYRMDLAGVYNMLPTASPEERLLRQQKVVALFEAMCAEEPANDAYQGILAYERAVLGSLWGLYGDVVKAEREMRRALDVFEGYALDKKDPLAQLRLGRTLHMLGTFYLHQGRDEEGLRLLKRVIDLEEVVARDFPEKPYLRTQLQDAAWSVAMWHMARGHWDQAEQDFAKLRARSTALVKRYPDLVNIRIQLVGYLVNHAELLLGLGRIAEAQVCQTECVRLLEGMVQKTPAEWEPRLRLARILASAPTALGPNVSRAVELISQCPKDASTDLAYWLGLAIVYSRAGDYGPARQAAERALQPWLDPRDQAIIRIHLAQIHARQGDLATARQHYTAAETWYRRFPYEPQSLRLRRELAPLLGLPVPPYPPRQSPHEFWNGP